MMAGGIMMADGSGLTGVLKHNVGHPTVERAVGINKTLEARNPITPLVVGQA
jgi:hypothetical protein